MSIQGDLRKFLVTTPEVQALVTAGTIASDNVMTTGYLFTGSPYKKVETLNKAAILVIRQDEDSEPPRPGSNFDFPKLTLDIWASPTRDANGDVQDYDADDVIRTVYKAIRKYIHTVNSANSPKNWAGTVIVSSEVQEGPTYSDVREGNGARMARVIIGVTL